MDKNDKGPETVAPEKETVKPEKETAKPENAKPALKQARWPGQNANAGIKNAKSVHGRKPIGRGSSRGR